MPDRGEELLVREAARVVAAKSAKSGPRERRMARERREENEQEERKGGKEKRLAEDAPGDAATLRARTGTRAWTMHLEAAKKKHPCARIPSKRARTGKDGGANEKSARA